jgi:hypothetical protein
MIIGHRAETRDINRGRIECVGEAVQLLKVEVLYDVVIGNGNRSSLCELG